MKIIEDKVFKLQIFMNNHLLVFRQSDGEHIAAVFFLGGFQGTALSARTNG